MLVDTHCHIHEASYPLAVLDVISRAKLADVNQMICIGTTIDDSRVALEFASNHDEIFASIGIHPHEADINTDGLEGLLQLGNSSIIAVGEIGLDYHYDNCPHDIQMQALKNQIDLALKYNLPIIFHVREAFDDFWSILDSYTSAGKQIRGVLHSFTDTKENMQEAIKRGLYIGVNGYSTFVKDESQQTMFSMIPLERILLETDAPFLTPAPFRGKVNEPAFVRNVAEYLAESRHVSFDEVANVTTTNARKLFNLK
jgi:TatD DNase family protein